MKNHDIFKTILVVAAIGFIGMIIYSKLNPTVGKAINVSDMGTPLEVQAYQDKDESICYSFSKSSIYGESPVSTEGLFLENEYKSLTTKASQYPLSSVVFKGYEGESNGEKCIVKITANDVLISHSGSDSFSCIDLRVPVLKNGYTACMIKEQNFFYYWTNWVLALIIGIPLLYLESRSMSVRDFWKNRKSK